MVTYVASISVKGCFPGFINVLQGWIHLTLWNVKILQPSTFSWHCVTHRQYDVLKNKVCVCVIGGSLDFNWGGWDLSHGWNRINGIEHDKHKVSMCLIPLHSLHSSHYYELPSHQQPPVVCVLLYLCSDCTLFSLFHRPSSSPLALFLPPPFWPQHPTFLRRGADLHTSDKR